MSIAKQLYQLQEVDLEIESKEQALHQIADQLGESEVVASARTKLTSESQRLEELARQQHSLEWEIDGLAGKLTTAEGELYSGRIGNPKELANLQHEVDSLKANRSGLEDKLLEVMDQVELATASVTNTGSELKAVEAEWHHQQQRLSADVEQLKTVLSELKDKRQLLSARIDPQTVAFYQHLKEQKGQAVVKVVQGICRGCRISLSSVELQRVRGDSLVQCSSCGRILFSG